tara:strand:- start:36831 stop:36956 length:126 start_codon:yes stop_codon:yes gene_type:complete
MDHPAQELYLLRLSGMEELPAGDIFSWKTGCIETLRHHILI